MGPKRELVRLREDIRRAATGFVDFADGTDFTFVVNYYARMDNLVPLVEMVRWVRAFLYYHVLLLALKLCMFQRAFWHIGQSDQPFQHCSPQFMHGRDTEAQKERSSGSSTQAVSDASGSIGCPSADKMP